MIRWTSEAAATALAAARAATAAAAGPRRGLDGASPGFSTSCAGQRSARRTAAGLLFANTRFALLEMRLNYVLFNNK